MLVIRVGVVLRRCEDGIAPCQRRAFFPSLDELVERADIRSEPVDATVDAYRIVDQHFG